MYYFSMSCIANYFKQMKLTLTNELFANLKHMIIYYYTSFWPHKKKQLLKLKCSFPLMTFIFYYNLMSEVVTKWLGF